MENGIYTRKELQVVLYYKEGAVPFVIVNNDGYANKPVVLTGERAERLVHAINTCLNEDDEVKGS